MNKIKALIAVVCLAAGFIGILSAFKAYELWKAYREVIEIRFPPPSVWENEMKPVIDAYELFFPLCLAASIISAASIPLLLLAWRFRLRKLDDLVVS